MKKSWKQILCGISVFFFLFAIFCCSICNLTQNSAQANVAVQSVSILASVKNNHSCCPPPGNSSNQKKCQDNNFSLVLQPEKLNDLGQGTGHEVSKIIFHFNAVTGNLSSLVLAENFSHSPPKLLQKSVPIYLSNRVLRL